MNNELEEKYRTISTLEDNLKKESKVVMLYKDGLAKLQDKKEVEWNNMNRVYVEQIKRLEETIKELMEYNDNKRMTRIAGHKTNSKGNVSFSYYSPAKGLQESNKLEVVSDNRSEISGQ